MLSEPPRSELPISAFDLIDLNDLVDVVYPDEEE